MYEDIYNEFLSKDNWGAYYNNRFYFTIKTTNNHFDVGLSNTIKELDIPVQRKLQEEHAPALFHEFIHYLHEISTQAGHITMLMDLRLKSVFTHWLVQDMTSSESLGLAGNLSVQKAYAAAKTVIDVLDGTGPEVITGKIMKAISYQMETQEVEVPEADGYVPIKLLVPVVIFESREKGILLENKLRFNKYYLYEGIAYELDRHIDMQVKGLDQINDYNKNSEYTVLRSFAEYLFDDIEKITYLSVASLALQYADPGAMFVEMITKIKGDSETGIKQSESVAAKKKKISDLLINKQGDFEDTFDEFLALYQKKPLLLKAYQHISKQAKILYNKRINNPCFEVEVILSGRYMELFSFTNVCDFMYIFDEPIDYMRDYFGSALNSDTSESLQVLAAYDHYFFSHHFLPTQKVEEKNHTCPFYYSCDLPLRLEQESICKSKPWRIYDYNAKADHKQCSYGSGVGHAKGFTI